MNNLIRTDHLDVEAKRAFWNEQVNKFIASGQGQTDFCRDNNLNYDHFAYFKQQWKKKNKKKAKPNKQTQPSQQFIELSVPEPQIEQNITILLGNGLEVKLPSTYSTTKIVELINHLRR